MIKVPSTYFIDTDGVLVVRYTDDSVRPLYAYDKTATTPDSGDDSGSGGDDVPIS